MGGMRRTRGKHTRVSVCLFEREKQGERHCGSVVTISFQQVCDHRLSVNAPMRLKEV